MWANVTNGSLFPKGLNCGVPAGIDGFTKFMHTILTQVVQCLSDIATTNVCKVDSSIDILLGTG